jgi:diguanylate cyclase (GGDEF)-like protein/PAS domain S-box-containing protein
MKPAENAQPRRVDAAQGERQLTYSEARFVASEIHGSLQLDAILRRTRRMLQSRLNLLRASLAQRRTSEVSATLYTAGEEDAPASIGPRVIALEPSRLADALARRARVIAPIDGDHAPDVLEQKYLLPGGTQAVLYLPLECRGTFKGVLVLALAEPLAPTGEADEYVEYVLEVLALAIENSDAFYSERRRVRELKLVSEIARQAVALESLDEFIRRTVNLLREGFDYSSVQVWDATDGQERLVLRFAVDKLGDPEKRDRTMVSKCRELDRAVFDNKVSVDAGSGSEPATASQLVVPIRLRNKFVGVLSLESTRLDAFGPEDVSIMEGVASLIASAFDNLRSFESAQQSNEFLQAILDSARDVAILSTDSHGYVVTSSVGSQAVFRMSPKELLGRDLLALFTSPRLQREMALYLNDLQDEGTAPLDRHRVPHGNPPQLESFLDVALQRVFDAEKQPLGFLCMVRDVTENVRLERSLEALSITDDLTGLYNQRRFFTALEAELERSQRYGRRLSLLFFDLDGFKGFNDTLGHLRGDEVLQETGALVLSLVRANVDTCYRYGGDEFTVIMPETNLDAAQALAERLRAELFKSFGGMITASIGIAESSGAIRARDVVEKADRAMYAAKQRGGNAVSLEVR